MTEVGKEPGISWLSVIWSARHDPAARILNVDLLAVLVAILLPWSTSGVSIALTLWLIALAFTVEPRALSRSLARPACALPIAFFALALLGMLWSDAPWSARLHGVSPLAKFLALPLIIYHFERSPRGLWVFVGFLMSCALLAAMSCVAAFDPDLSAKLYFSRGPYFPVNGVFVKNYIDQGQEFTLCAVALAYPIATALREKKTAQALLLTAAALWLVANMLFVVVSRTALVTMPIMLAVFALLHLRWRGAVATLVVAALIAAAVWSTSPSLRATFDKFLADYQQTEVQNNPNGMGSRLEYWRKSLRFIADAPLIGHGTGSTRGLFERAAVGQTGVRAEIVGDPHNQTLNAAVQWGALGVVALYAMWFVHLRLFRGEGLAAWIGLLVVVQNIFTSLFNSHLFDFNEGWLYVLGVGIAGGMTLGGKEIASRATGHGGSPATIVTSTITTSTIKTWRRPRMSASAVKQTILVCHGAWGGGWSWKKMHPLMRAAGYRLLTPSYTGLGERAHLANPSVDLETHIQDILNVITYEDLRDIVLLGHSYGGMVATGVADRVGDKIAQLIYLDAFVPGDGQCLLDFLNESERQRMRGLARSGDGWRVPPNPTPPDTPEADLEWLAARRVDMPIKCFELKLRLENGERMPPRSYIYCTRTAPADPFGQFAGRAKSEPGWRYFEIDASHSPIVTAPDALMALLEKIVAG